MITSLLGHSSLEELVLAHVRGDHALDLPPSPLKASNLFKPRLKEEAEAKVVDAGIVGHGRQLFGALEKHGERLRNA